MDMLEFAINMELDGQKYYEEQAALHSKDGLKPVFAMLAVEESGHAALLKSKAGGRALSLAEPQRLDLKNVFAGMAAFKSEEKAAPDQLDAYILAESKEQQSIDLYRKMLGEAGSDKELFTFLVQQEEEHFAILEEIVKQVGRPKTWVESAEFGVREEY